MGRGRSDFGGFRNFRVLQDVFRGAEVRFPSLAESLARAGGISVFLSVEMIMHC